LRGEEGERSKTAEAGEAGWCRVRGRREEVVVVGARRCGGGGAWQVGDP